MSKKKYPHTLPQTFDQRVRAVHATETGELVGWRIQIDLEPGRIKDIRLGQVLRVTLSKKRSLHV